MKVGSPRPDSDARLATSVMVTSFMRRALGRRKSLNDPRVSFEMPSEEIERLADQLSGLSRAPRAPSSLSSSFSEAEGELTGWADCHPNANESFDNIVEMAKGKQVAVFLDYDGTLTPIVRNPDRAFMSEEMRTAVRDVAKVFPTAIISGRGREKVQGFVKLEELYYAGSHGLDIVGPSCRGTGHPVEARDITGYQPAAEFAPEINAVHDELVMAIKSIQGSRVEHNKFCLSVHFRNCQEDVLEELKTIVETVVAEHKLLDITRGRKVFEVRPKVEWDKGRAVQYLLGALGLEGNDVLPVYLGDDRTDEDAFRVMRNEPTGLGILVSTKPKATQATYHLQDPAEVLTFLVNLAAMANGQVNGAAARPWGYGV